jgi:hypothetical protein
MNRDSIICKFKSTILYRCTYTTSAFSYPTRIYDNNIQFRALTVILENLYYERQISPTNHVINIKQSHGMCSYDIRDIYPDSMCSRPSSEKIQLICQAQKYMVNAMMATLRFLTTNELLIKR